MQRALWQSSCRIGSSASATASSALFFKAMRLVQTSAYVQHRIKIWEMEADRQKAKDIRSDASTASSQTPVSVHVHGKDKVEGTLGTTDYPNDYVLEMNIKGDILCSLFNDTPWDLRRPLPASGDLSFLPSTLASDYELNGQGLTARDVTWHSSAHILGWSLESHFGDQIFLEDGPSLAHQSTASGGFFYDAVLSRSGPSLVNESLSEFNRHGVATSAVESVVDFGRAYSRMKLITDPLHSFHINDSDMDALNSLSNASRMRKFPLNAFKVLRTGSAHLGSDPSVQVSRVYGIAFPKTAQLKDWESVQDMAAKRDHRVIGKQQGLFMMSPLAPGSAFMLPHGTRIANRLMEFIRAEYRAFDYDEVVTPLMFNKEVWQTSGHWENYREDMFLISQDSVGFHFGLKPMNCPGHCVLFDSKSYSYRELPVRIAEFSPLHRNEASGALTGLTRVRKFHQDDAHIFCTPDQVLSEIRGALAFIDRVYKALGFPTYSLALSTRPTKYIGTVEQWDRAEEALRQALAETGRPISLKRVMAHSTAPRLISCVERMMAILMEHHGGRWPFWLSPRQAVVIPATTAPDVVAYAEKVARSLSANGVEGGETASKTGVFYYVDARTHDADATLAKRVRDAWANRYNFVIVVGEREAKSGMLSVRTMVGEGTKDTSSEMRAEELLQLWSKLTAENK
ncbi:hypothetical protein BC829DRAFT_404352 [Chytridium lagenaria]|nr:hypothetical protein BC829DRAFT_404352 [Chytridium lagenaria]